MQVNVQGPLYCSRAVLPLMVERGHGRVVNVSSAAGFGVIPMISSYVVSKAALYRLTEALAAETRDHGVGVFAINPGLVRTTMSETPFLVANRASRRFLGIGSTPVKTSHPRAPASWWYSWRRGKQMYCPADASGWARIRATWSPAQHR